MTTTTAWYSEQQRPHTGVHEYRRPDGTTVHCTAVGNQPPTWPDAHSLGIVLLDGWVRCVAPGTLISRAPFGP